MDDTRLLEDAASAIGRSITGWNTQHGVVVAVLDDGTFWQPLLENRITDCMGDALRLAVKLSLTIQRPWMDDERTDTREVRVWSSNPEYVYESLICVDHCAATRRAIVRAAAAMVKP